MEGEESSGAHSAGARATKRRRPSRASRDRAGAYLGSAEGVDASPCLSLSLPSLSLSLEGAFTPPAGRGDEAEAPEPGAGEWEEPW